MSATKVHAHLYTDDTVTVVRHSETTIWLELGDVTVFLDEEQLARIHAATAPAVAARPVSLPPWLYDTNGQLASR